jgi:protein SCO1/2
MANARHLAACAAGLLMMLGGAAPASAHSKLFGAPMAEKDAMIERTEPKGYRPPDVKTLGGPFELTDPKGQTVTQDSFPGKWILLTFGFPGCRESCPIALDSLSKALEIMGPEAEALQTLFVDISMDRKPDHKAMAQFVSNFHESIVGLSGTRAQVSAMVRNYKIRREYGHVMVSTRETGPRIDHSTFVFVIDPQRRTRSFFYHDLPAEKMVDHIRKAFAQGG